MEMSRVYRIFLSLFCVFVIMACTDNRKLEIIHQAEGLMQEQPDSALRVLQTINRHSLRGETLARYALIYSIAQDKSGLDVTNDSLLRIAYEYYCQHPEDSLYARSQYYMGLYLCLTEQTDSAYSCLLRARTASEAEEDYYTAYLATDRMRRIAEISDTALCLTLSKDAYKLYQKHGADNPVNEAYLLIGIGDTYSRCGDGDSAIHYYNIALDKAESVGDSIAIASVFYKMSLYYWHYKQHVKALDCAKLVLSYKKYVDLPLAKILALCYTENAEYDKARQYINALSSSVSKEDHLITLSLQHRFSAKTGDADAAQEYFDSACNVAADMYLSTQKDKLGLLRKNMHEEMERQRAEYRGRIFAICLGFSIVTLFLIVCLFVKYRRAKKAEIVHQKIQYRTLEELNKKEEERFHAEEERFRAEEALLRQEKAHKEQMMAQTRNYVKNMVGVFRELEQYRTEQKKQKEEEKQNNSNSKDKQKKKVASLMLHDKAWAEILAYLEACEGSFITRFKEKHPDISDSDFQLCVLLRCNLSNPELEQVYSIAAQSVKTRQLLLKNKLGIVDKNTSLRQYIMQF